MYREEWEELNVKTKVMSPVCLHLSVHHFLSKQDMSEAHEGFKITGTFSPNAPLIC